jgi:ubiquinone/menaquinone biosynthesis C-methylase UbiE
MSTKSRLSGLLSKALGYPSLVIRIQAPTIMRMLNLQSTDAVLDAGCGSGYFTSEIAAKSHLSVGVDLKLMQRLALVLAKQPTKAYAKADIQRLPFADGKFDKILLSSVLQVVNNDALLLRECRRVLKKGGVLVLTVPLDYCYFEPLNKHKQQLGLKAGAIGKAYYKPAEVADALRNGGFSILEFEFSPKKLGSVVTELEIYLWHCFKLPFLSTVCFPLFYGLLFVEHRANRGQAGDQLVIKAQKLDEFI